MPHGTRTQPDATWTTGNYTPPTADWASIDGKVFAAMNGATGGAHQLAGNTQIGGSGLALTGPLTLYGGILRSDSGASKFVLGNNDFPQLGAGHALSTRTLLTSCIGGIATSVPTPDTGLGPSWAALFSPRALWRWSAPLGGAQSVATAFNFALGDPFSNNGQRPDINPELWVPLRVHTGSTLSQAVFTFRVPTPRTAVPGRMPKFRIVRRDTVLGTAVPLKSTTKDANGFTADANGFISPAQPASGAAWYAQGAGQTLTYLCDQNNAVDISQYTYWAHIVEEAGATTYPLALRLCDPCQAASAGTNLALNGIFAVDGYMPTAGDRMLVKDQTNQAQNGIYNALTGAWGSAGDMNQNSKVLQGMLVTVMNGTKNVASVWQLQTIQPPQGFSLGNTLLTFGAPVAYGNIYHSVQATFTGIADLHFQ